MKYPVNLKYLIKYSLKLNKVKASNSKINEVKKKLIQAGFTEVIEQNSCKYVIRAVSSICSTRYNPLSASKIMANTKVNACPLCSTEPIPVELAEGRKARYCMEHNVTIPCIV